MDANSSSDQVLECLNDIAEDFYKKEGLMYNRERDHYTPWGARLEKMLIVNEVIYTKNSKAWSIGPLTE